MWVDDDNNENCFSTDSEEMEDTPILSTPKHSHEEAITALTIAIKWAEENNRTCADIMNLQKLRTEATQLRLEKSSVQLKISNFFKVN